MVKIECPPVAGRGGVSPGFQIDSLGKESMGKFAFNLIGSQPGREKYGRCELILAHAAKVGDGIQIALIGGFLKIVQGLLPAA